MTELEQAVKEAAPLTPAERKTVEVLLAERKGEDEKVRNLNASHRRPRAERLAPAVPARRAVRSTTSKSQAAILYLNDGRRAEAEAAEAYNYLRYVLSAAGQFDDGIRNVQKFVDLKPQTNSYGLASARCCCWRAATTGRGGVRALSADHGQRQLDQVLMGVAYSRFLRGSFDGGPRGGGEIEESITRAPDLLAVDEAIAWRWPRRARAEAALKEVDRMERDAAASERLRRGVGGVRARRDAGGAARTSSVQALKQLDEARAQRREARRRGANRLRAKR